MRQLARLLFSTLTFLSLLLSMTSLLLWARSYFRTDVITWAASRSRPPILGELLDVRSNNGGFFIDHNTLAVKPGRTASPSADHWSYSHSTPGWQWQSGRPWHGLGLARELYWFDFFWYLEKYEPGDPALMEAKFSLALPYWVPFLFFAILPGARWFLWRRTRRCRLAIGKCKKCGYNLTGNISGICPECGTAIAAKPQSP
jgi:hypothetical protein